MKMILVCENDAEREEVARVFENMKKDSENYSPIYGAVDYCEGKNIKTIIADNPIVYSLKDEEYTVFNFQTGKIEEHVEGDLAGLANLPDEDFPLL